jgi:enoyl-CoA hydratase/carnithine racemase
MGFVQVERRGGAAVVTYANPPYGTMTAAGAQEMLDLMRPLAADPAVRSIVITGGVPGIFIRHYDVDELSAMGEALQAQPPPPADGPPKQGFLAMVDLIAAMPKPVVAAINGLCMGGGFELALACDLRIAAPAAELGLTEVRLGIIPGGGGTQRLPRLIGPGRAKDLILTGRRLNAAEAFAIGLVQRLAPEGRLLEVALAVAEQIAENAPLAVAAAKRAVDRGLDLEMDAALALELEQYETVLRSEDRLEGLRAFAEKRRPAWKGR